jgi:ABC-type dipeptide/oligopeptide/nickel transport system permease component/ABC-type dipeptide/oligopeptide/nickel transport system permease subunit
MHQWSLRYWSLKLVSLGGMSLAVFALPHLMPGKPVTFYETWPVSAQQRAHLVSEYGFDHPLSTQYAIWWRRLLTGQWGSSRYSNRPVLHDIWRATRLTLGLLLWTLLACGLGTAALGGMRRLAPWLGALLPRSKLLHMLEALPTFLVAVLLRELALWQLGWVNMVNVPLFEPYYFLSPLYMLFPASILALTPLRIWYTRPSELRAQRPLLRQRWQYFRTLLHPHLESFLLDVSLTEYIFAFPGLGTLGIEALQRRDLPLLQGCILCTGALYFVLRCLCEPAQLHLTLSPASMPGPHSAGKAVYNGLWCLLILGVITVWAPALLLYDPMEIHSHDQFLAPGYRYTLGTDFLGRDVLSRTVKGFRSCIPRVLCLTALVGGVSWLGRSDQRGWRGLFSLLWCGGLTLLHAMPFFVLAFMVFMVFEHQFWALDIALLIACLPVAAQLLTGEITLLQRAAQLARLGGLMLLLEVTFYFLNLSSESFAPTWGSDIRHGMHYGHMNIWMVLAPACAVIWSRYNLYQLSYGLPRQPHIAAGNHHATTRQCDSEDATR